MHQKLRINEKIPVINGNLVEILYILGELKDLIGNLMNEGTIFWNNDIHAYQDCVY